MVGYRGVEELSLLFWAATRARFILCQSLNLKWFWPSIRLQVRVEIIEISSFPGVSIMESIRILDHDVNVLIRSGLDPSLLSSLYDCACAISTALKVWPSDSDYDVISTTHFWLVCTSTPGAAPLLLVRKVCMLPVLGALWVEQQMLACLYLCFLFIHVIFRYRFDRLKHFRAAKIRELSVCRSGLKELFYLICSVKNV